ncbi:MAG: phosphoribosylformylglycinamidine cyclo-ligase [Candidatus Thalassarchaeaceae archaeon]|jgi:phosphoribosylformylglycinamidine cyclo-ligase|nr:phosphoribosylformylglycinamidine cyclo-ligase [Candidatus Thalassarchaeaceae archaeon]
MSDEAEGLNYASSGVDIDLEGASVASLVGALSRSVRVPGTPGAPVDLPGGFGGLIEFGDNLLALATDGVGSKLQIASMMNHWSGVGIDCMAMNVNDLLCVGAEPIAFVDYIAVPKPDPDQHAAIGASLAEACRIARVTLAGGETASLPGIVTELDLSGTALGWLPKGMAITGANISDGDVMIGLPASGIHSNGFSLVRKVVELSGCAYTDPAPFATEFAGREIVRMKDGGVTLGEVLLNPTRIYVDPVTDLIDACRAGSGPCPADALHGICHVTGGGLSNLLRLHDSLGWHIDNPMPSLPEFDWVQTTGGITDREMARTFNLGMGMVLVVDSEHANAVCDWVATRLEGTQIVGSVCNHGHKVTHVNPEIVFEHY